jgi:hypothetical protein
MAYAVSVSALLAYSHARTTLLCNLNIPSVMHVLVLTSMLHAPVHNVTLLTPLTKRLSSYALVLTSTCLHVVLVTLRIKHTMYALVLTTVCCIYCSTVTLPTLLITTGC